MRTDCFENVNEPVQSSRSRNAKVCACARGRASEGVSEWVRDKDRAGAGVTMFCRGVMGWIREGKHQERAEPGMMGGCGWKGTDV